MRLYSLSVTLVLLTQVYESKLSVSDVLKLPSAIQPDIVDNILDSLVDALPHGAAKALLLNSLNNPEIEQSVKKNANTPSKNKKKGNTDQRQILSLAETALNTIQVAPEDAQDVKDEIEKIKYVVASGSLTRTFGSNLFPDKDIKKEDKDKVNMNNQPQIPLRRRPGVRRLRAI